jgi:hypothetical protein
MSRRVFLVEAGRHGPGHGVDGKAVVVEADLDDNGAFADVVAPPEFVAKWPRIKVSHSMGGWTECPGPARILESDQYQELVDSLKKS